MTMNKQIIEHATNRYAPANFLNSTMKQAFIAGAEFVLPKWIPVRESLPEKNTKNYGAQVLGTDGKNIFVCNYTVGGERDIETESEDENAFDFDKKRGMIFLKAGWYECEEQSHHPEADEAWYPRNITHWMPLPSLPKPE